MDLNGRIAIITGGGRGIGRAISLRLAAERAVVAICARTGEELREVREKITGGGGRCEHAIVDVTKVEEVEEFVANVRTLGGGIDVLINNAGFCGPSRLVEEVTEEEYKRTMATNIDSVFHFTRFVVPIMKEQNAGIIITISSGCGRRGYPGLSIYSASKFAVQGFMESVAREVEATRIRCLVINPGAVATRMRADVFGEDEASRQQAPEVVAEVIRGIIMEEITVPNGGGICIRGGEITEVYGRGE